jgi:hypothetical protein
VPDHAASPTLPLEDLPAQGEPIEGDYTLWPTPEVMPAMRALPTPSQPDDESDQRAPWADLIRDAADPGDSVPWQPAPSASLSDPTEPLAWGSLAEAEQLAPWDGLLAEETASLAPWGGLAPEESQPALWNSPTLEEIDSPAPWASLRAAATEQSASWDNPTSEETDAPTPSSTPWASLRPAATEQSAPWENPTLAEIEQSASWDSLRAMDIEPPAPEEPQQSIVWEQPSGWQADPPASSSAALEPLPWELSTADSAADQPAFESAFAPEPAEYEPSVQFEPEQAIQASDAPLVSEPTAPEFVGRHAADDLGFSLDWSEPEAEQAPEPAAPVSLHTGEPIADDLGFSLDWSDPQIDSPAQSPLPNVDAIADTSIFMAHWGDQDLAASQPPIVETLPADDTAAATTMPFDRWPSAELDTVPIDPLQAQQESLPAAPEQDPGQDESLVIAEQEAPPWYAPTLHFNDQLPFDSYAEAPLEAFGADWVDPPLSGEPVSDVVAEPPAEPLLEAFANSWNDASLPGEPSPYVAADGSAETFGAWDDMQAPSEPSSNIVAEAPLEALAPASDEAPIAGADALAYDTAIQPLGDAPSVEPVLETPGVPADASEQIASNLLPAADISPELIARMLGMIQSYGPAWFKMWSLELKERPERLPVVLGEVTADPVLLAQANDPTIQAALLAAIEAYASPPVHPSRLSAAASLPSPVMTSQSSSDQDEVPDWLSLRVKWNGHGGGA